MINFPLHTKNIFIPNEVSEKILSHLSATELSKIAGVCRNWQDLSSKNSLWGPVVFNEFRLLYEMAKHIPNISWKSQCIKAVQIIKEQLAIEQQMNQMEDITPTCKFDDHHDFNGGSPGIPG